MTTPGPEPRAEVVDAILDVFESLADKGPTAEQEAILASATRAEAELALAAAQAKADDMKRILIAIGNDPRSVEGDPGLDGYPGTEPGMPPNATQVLALQSYWPWSPTHRDDVAYLTRNWSPEDWDLLERVHGDGAPGGFHRL